MNQHPKVTIQEGKLYGKICSDYTGRNYFSFQGIPYAKSPIGELRFKAPQPPQSWTGIRDATNEGHMCYHRSQYKGYTGSDDCLFLNVYTPQLPTKNEFVLKPVMFWIHGGQYLYGSGNTDMYGPDYLITEDVVVVTINYRFGILGFLSLEDPSLGIPGNAGLKDQVMALKWVQRNIKHFGGDSNNVTIFGQSSGGASVHYLMLSPMAKGLFHKAIIQSGNALDYWTRGQSSATLVAKALKLDVVNEKEILERLQNMSVQEVFKVQEEMDGEVIQYKKGMVGFVIETQSNEPAFLAEDPVALIKSGTYNQVPTIIGYTSREGIYFLMYCKLKFGKFKMYKDIERYIPFPLGFEKGTDLSKSIAGRIKSFYFGDEEPSEEKLENALVMQMDCNFLYSMSILLRYLSVTSSAPVYLYRMSLHSTLNIYKKIGRIQHPGAAHGDDLGYLFKTLITPKKLGLTEKQGIRRFVKLWTTFAKNGNPNPKESDPLIDVNWKPIEEDALHYLNIGENLTTGVNPDAQRMQLWNDFFSIGQANSNK